MVLRVGFVVAMVVASCGPASPAAAELPRSGTFTDDTTAVGPDGHAALISEGSPLTVRLADPGGRLGAPIAIAPGSGPFATIAVGPGGATLAVWSSGGPEAVLMSAYRPPGGAFETPTVLSDRPPDGEQWPATEFDAAGDVTIAWAAGEPEDRMLVRVRSLTAGWQPPESIPAPGPFRPQLAVTASGTATLTWTEDGPTVDSDRVVVATRPPGGAFGPKRTLAGVQRNPGAPVLATNDRGDTVVAWLELQRVRRDVRFDIRAAFRRGGGPFGAPVVVTGARRGGAFPSVSVGPDGRMILAWTANDATRTVEARVRTRGGRLLPSRILTRDHEVNSGVTALATGPGVVAWYDRDPGLSFLRSARATPGGRFGPRRLRLTTPTFGDVPELFAVPGGLMLLTPGRRLLRTPD